MDPIQKKIHDLSSGRQISKFSQFSEGYSSFLKQRSYQHSVNPVVATETGIYGDVNHFELILGKDDDQQTTDTSKALLVFYGLLDTDELRKEAQEAQDRFLEIDDELNDEKASSAQNSLDIQIGLLSEHFLFLCTISRIIVRLIERCRSLTEQCVGGLLVVYPKGDTPIDLSVVLDELSRMLRQIEIWDLMINSSKMKFLWVIYKGKVFNHYQLMIDSEGTAVKGVGTFIEELDVFFAGNFFEMCLTEISSTRGVAQKDSLNAFSAAVLLRIKSLLKDSQKYKSDVSDFIESGVIVSVCLLTVFHYNYFRTISGNSSIFKQLLILTTKHCCISITSSLLWRPETFIALHAADLIGKQLTGYSKNLQIQRKLNLQEKLVSLQKPVGFSLQVLVQIFEMNGVFGGSRKLKSAEDLHNATRVLKAYLHTAGILRYTVTSIINLHIVLEFDLTRHALVGIGKLIELMVSMRWSVEELCRGIKFNMQIAEELYRHKLLTAIEQLRKKATKQPDGRKWTILQILEKCVNGPLTRKRLQVLQLINKDNLDLDEGNINQLLCDIEHCLDPFTELHSLLDTSFLFANRSILKVYLKNFLALNEDPMRLQNFISAQTNGKPAGSAVTLFRETLQVELFQRLSREIENNLRLDFHKKLNKKSSEALNSPSIRDIRPLVSLKPLQAFNEYYDIKAHISSELSETFYNLVTVSPHDCRTYGEMQNMGECNYEVETVPDGLPVRSVDQACDIMDILKDLCTFVLSYCYDMNAQVFVEKSSRNKHLNAIVVAHVSQSIKTHGIGIINTTVNVTYQFLKKKFNLFSQLLFDEHIKSRLMRDQRIVTDRIMTKKVPVYPLDAAVNVIKHLRTMITTPAESFMDRFRDIIIEMGNALGFVRSMRSGRLEMGANAIENYFDWSDYSGETSYHQQTTTADGFEPLQDSLTNLRAAIQSLEDNFSESADYLKMLVIAFQRARNEKFDHLRRFYLMVPALTMNYVEHMITMKEDLTGVSRSRSHQYTDDGFTIGLVYLLTLLDQLNAFNSLHWFATVDKYYTDQIEKLKSTALSTSDFDPEKLLQTQSLSEKRFRSLQREFNLLYYNVSSSKMFFQ